MDNIMRNEKTTCLRLPFFQIILNIFCLARHILFFGRCALGCSHLLFTLDLIKYSFTDFPIALFYDVQDVTSDNCCTILFFCWKYCFFFFESAVLPGLQNGNLFISLVYIFQSFFFPKLRNRLQGCTRNLDFGKEFISTSNIFKGEGEGHSRFI